MNEAPFSGGRITEGVVRVGDTVRRPRQANAELVRTLLGRVEELGLELAPRYCGVDEQGREMFRFLEGDVPDELDAGHSDATLVAAARLICRFHHATAGSSLAAGCEVVCHGDLSPCNAVFRGGVPVALIDFDNAAPGKRLDDLGYALFLWLNIGTDGPAPAEQARRIRVFCEAYGVPTGDGIVAAISSAVAVNIERLRAKTLSFEPLCGGAVQLLQRDVDRVQQVLVVLFLTRQHLMSCAPATVSFCTCSRSIVVGISPP